MTNKQKKNYYLPILLFAADIWDVNIKNKS